MTMIVQTIFAWVLIVIMIVAAFPLASWLLAKSPRHDGAWVTALLTLSLSIGTLTILMFWESLLGISFSLLGILLPYSGVMILGIWLWYRSLRGQSSLMRDIRLGWVSSARTYSSINLVTVIIGAAICFNAAYWPFHHDDVLGIYGKYAKLMYETGRLVPFAGRDDAFYQAYPIEIPLSYTFAFLASSWENEYLARLIPALLSVGCLPAVFVLGRMIYDKRAGEAAALLLALTPSYVRWASSGYVDLPMAFFYTLAAIFAWRLYNSRQTVDAVLLGTMLGLTAWTKNAGLLGIVLISLWLVYSAAVTKQIRWQHIFLTIGVCTVIAAPWYIRNWIEARLIVPPTAWTDQAQRTLGNLLVFITQPQNFALTGWIIVSGIVSALFTLRQEQQSRILLLFLTLPFLAVWWFLISYDPRFLLLFLPMLSVIGAGYTVEIWDKISAKVRSAVRVPLVVVILILTSWMLWMTVEFKGEILRQPFMGNEAKHAIVLHKSGN
jgi:4-amino-4-deoxy-L-arabinose transferase-like glycosyltransferase